MSTRRALERVARTPAFRAFGVLVIVAAALAVLAFFPAGERISGRRAPLDTAVVFDEPVVHHYK